MPSNSKLQPERRAWATPLVILAVLIISFGLFIPFLGFYWDDWPVILTGRFFGTAGYTEFYQYDRPVSAWTYIVTFPILGSSAANWHIFSLLLRWGTVLAMWWTLIRLWPSRRAETVGAALLFSIYPVFTQQAISVAYSQHWICYLLFFVSLGAMVQAQRADRRWFWVLTLLSVAASLLQLLTMEYFAGLDLLRPLILWFLIGERQQNWRQQVRQVFWQWLPYLLTLIGFVVWRLFFLEFPGEAANPPILLYQLMTSPVSSGLRFMQIALQDILHLFVSIWANTLSPASLDLTDRFFFLTWGVAFLVSVMLIVYLRRYARPPGEAPPAYDRRWSYQILSLGVAGVALGMLPVWFTDRQILVGAFSNRFALPAMFGASLVIVGLLDALIRLPVQRVVLLSMLVGLSVGLHLRVENDYRWTWVKQTRFYWQLAWRAPDIEPGTAILSDGEIFPSVGLYSTSMAISLLYPPAEPEAQLPYWFFSLGREFSHRMPELLAGIPIQGGVRHYEFNGNSQDSLVIYYEPDETDCLHVLTPQDGTNPDVPEITKQALPLSNLQRIQPEARQDGPSEEIFGPEPEQGWCYLFQKADLARQQGDWQAVAALGDEAGRQGYNLDNSQSNTPQEWVPFIEGYAQVGRWQEAVQMSAAVLSKQAEMAPRLCAVWQALAVLPPAAQEQAALEQAAAVRAALDALACTPLR